MGVGLAYQGEHWRLAVGYELTDWINMINSPDFTDGSSLGHINRRRSDLTLEGLSASLGVVF